ncbi:MAG TPA: thioesterase family protein [Candidatus Eremiobacteraceae bacterium]|nr:thioesterase family protein [Candidatus Eremiobacteraceae bacterium]
MTPFSIREYVRWGDVDAAGVICYGAYVRFIEIAETELFRAAGFPYGKVFERFDCWLPRASYKMEFRKPAVLDEQLTVNASVGRIGTSSIALRFEFSDDAGTRVADCDIVLVCVDKQTFKPKPVPKELREALARFT